MKKGSIMPVRSVSSSALDVELGERGEPDGTGSALAPPALARIPLYDVAKVAHYCLEVDALTVPMTVREGRTIYERNPI